MKYGSVCSGIEAASVAWEPLGWRPAFFSEIEDFPRKVLAHRFPGVPLHGDFTTIQHGHYEPIDLLVGGTPCQSFSIAGLRKGMDDHRGNLSLEFLRLADRLRPRWVVWENVPGVLSSNGGRDFGSFLGGMAELGYGFAYRVLDAQFFGVAQRRRRVFVVGYRGDHRPAVAVLFDRESLSGNPAPSREAGSAVAALTANGVGACGADDNQAQAGHLIAMHTTCAAFWRPGFGTLRTREQDSRENLICMAHGQGGAEIINDGDPSLTCNHEAPIVFQSWASPQNSMNPSGICPTLDVGKAGGMAIAFAENSRNEFGLEKGDGSRTGALSTGGGKPGQGCPTIVSPRGVRRLTPRECERLQGFPDDWTLIPGNWRKRKPEDHAETVDYLVRSGYSITGAAMLADCPDGPRYKAIGNSMAVPVMRWIGERIQQVEDIITKI